MAAGILAGFALGYSIDAALTMFRARRRFTVTDRGPVTRCAEKACPFVGYFAPYGNRCPEHRDPWDFLTPITPITTEENQ